MMLNNQNNQAHIDKIGALGNKSLGLQIRVKENGNQENFLGNIKEFLGFLSNTVYDHNGVVDYENTLKALNENDDVLKSLVDCIKCLKLLDIQDRGYYIENNLDENSTNGFITLPKIYGNDIDDGKKLLLQKTSLTLKLIRFGINPLKIKKYLEQDDADSNDFNWNKLIKTLLELKWYIKEINNCNLLDYYVGNYADIIALIKLIDFMEPILFPMDPNLERNGAVEAALNFLNDSASSLYRGAASTEVTASSLLLLSLYYVSNKDMNELSDEELKNFLESYISNNMLSDSYKSELKDACANNLLMFSIIHSRYCASIYRKSKCLKI